MTELIRPALYGARHPVVALTSLGGRSSPARRGVRAARPRRRPGLREHRHVRPHDLPPLRRGDLVAIADAGAYAASMASTYNGRPAAPQVLLEPDGPLMLGAAGDARGRPGHSARMRAS